MFATVVYPVCDLRFFLQGDELLLPRLHQVSRRNLTFLKSLGPVGLRRGSNVWPNEDFYCTARGLLRFPQGLKKRRPGEWFLGVPFVDFRSHSRRLFLNEQGAQRFEVGFRFTAKGPDRFKLFAGETRSIVRSLASYRAEVVTRDHRTEGRLIGPEIAGGIAQKYFQSTLPKESIQAHAGETRKFVHLGRAIIVIEYALDSGGEQNLLEFPSYGQSFQIEMPAGRLRVQYFNFRAEVDTPTWSIGYSESSTEFSRDVRIGIGRIHSVVEAGYLVVREYGRVRTWSAEAGEAALNALRQTAAFFETRSEGGTYEVRAVCFALYERSLPGRIVGLLETVYAVIEAERPEASEERAVQIINFILNQGEINVTNIGDGNQIITGSNVTVGDFFSNVSKVSQDSAASPEVKAALQQMNDQIAALLSGHEVSKRMGDKIKADAASINEEAVNPKPDRDYLKVTGKGLIEAAEAVAKVVGGPAVAAITALMGLFP